MFQRPELQLIISDKLIVYVELTVISFSMVDHLICSENSFKLLNSIFINTNLCSYKISYMYVMIAIIYKMFLKKALQILVAASETGYLSFGQCL